MSNFVTIEARAIKQAMRIVNSIIERRNTIPILSCAKLTLANDGLTIVGTDLDMYVKQTLDVIDGAGEWSICINASLLYDITTAAGSSIIRIEPAEQAKITIGEADAFYDLQTLPASDFPEPSGSRGDLIDTFSNGMLAETLDKVSYAISTEETRYYLNGVCWDIREKESRFVATDGHRLALCKHANGSAEPAIRIIPRKVVSFIIRHLAGSNVKIFSASNNTQIEIVTPFATLRTKLIDGTYPSYDRVIPDMNKAEFKFKFKKDELLTALDYVGAVTKGNDYRAVKICNENGRITLQRHSPEFGTAKALTQCDWPEGKAPDFGVNIKYMKQLAGKCSDSLTFHMENAASPILVTDANKDMLRVLMPMRV